MRSDERESKQRQKSEQERRDTSIVDRGTVTRQSIFKPEGRG